MASAPAAAIPGHRDEEVAEAGEAEGDSEREESDSEPGKQ